MTPEEKKAARAKREAGYHQKTKGAPRHERRKVAQRIASKAYLEKNRAVVLARRRNNNRVNKVRYLEIRYKLKIKRPPTAACEACDIPFETTKHGPCMDHDHATNEHRGWLCHHCNSAIGYAKDSRDRLLLLVAYLDKVELLA